MDLLHTLLLSAVEGVTEFLPISSTGHLILVSNLLGIQNSEFTKSFEIIIQLGAILAVVAVYSKTIFSNRNYWPKLLVSFIPTAIVGFTLYPIIKNILLDNPIFTLISLFLGGIALIVVEKTQTKKDKNIDDLSLLGYRKALLIGCFQSISVIPGVSRAAATIVGGMLVGVNRQRSVEYSFLLAVPTMLAAVGFDLVKSHDTFSSSEYLILLTGFLGAFFFALLTIKIFLNYIKSHDFVLFGIYRIALAIIYYLVIVR